MNHDMLAQCILLSCSGLFLVRRVSHYLRFFQQEGYNHVRFKEWYLANKAWDRKGSAIALNAVFFTGLFSLFESTFFLTLLSLLLSGMLIYVAVQEGDPTYTGKVRLAMTKRASRIYYVACALLMLLFFISFIYILRQHLSQTLGVLWLWQMVLFQLPPLAVVAANLMLTPYEHALQAQFIAEAKEKLAAVDPYTIGITGSYGKTSTKKLLGSFLSQSLGGTFWPRQGINTEMGITRALREDLSAAHKYAVIEMGAYGEGSIRKLCRLTPPRAAIITAVGEMHLERMGEKENIYRAKSELAQEVPQDGILVCNGDNEGARRIAREFAKKNDTPLRTQ